MPFALSKGAMGTLFLDTDHRQPDFEVSGGVDREWTDESGKQALGARVKALTELARTLG